MCELLIFHLRGVKSHWHVLENVLASDDTFQSIVLRVNYDQMSQMQMSESINKLREEVESSAVLRCLYHVRSQVNQFVGGLFTQGLNMRI